MTSSRLGQAATPPLALRSLRCSTFNNPCFPLWERATQQAMGVGHSFLARLVTNLAPT